MSVFRGDVNVILNRLVRDGIIAGFQTSFDKLKPTTKCVGIAVRVAVRDALGRFADQVQVTVKGG